MFPETHVRYRGDKDWVELGEFLNEWIKKRATIKQIEYLDALQKQHGISTEIAVDDSRKEISERIAALAPKQEGGLNRGDSMEWGSAQRWVLFSIANSVYLEGRTC